MANTSSRRTGLTEENTSLRVLKRSATKPGVVEGSVAVLKQLPVMRVHHCGLCVSSPKEFVIEELWLQDHAQLQQGSRRHGHL